MRTKELWIGVVDELGVFDGGFEGVSDSDGVLERD